MLLLSITAQETWILYYIVVVVVIVKESVGDIVYHSNHCPQYLHVI
jgi:hypothetical protein